MQGADRVAVVAQYSPTARVTRSLSSYVRELVRCGYRVVVVSASEDPAELTWPSPPPSEVTVLRKPNVGYDFGSWAVALDHVPSIREARRVLLTNDSLLGPFAPLDGLLGRYESCRADVWGVTDSWQLGHHLQSYLLGFTGGILADPPLARFFQEVREQRTKMDVVMRYELGLSRLLVSEGYTMHAEFRSHRLGAGDANPTLASWRGLVEAGFPFVKRMVVEKPEVAPSGDRVAAVLAATYGARLSDWIDGGLQE